MADDRRKTNRACTGTVPKVKQNRNNTSYMNERESPRSWTNNLGPDLHRLNLSDYLRNSRRNCTMNTGTVEEPRHLIPTANGSITPNTSSSTSRRNSSGAVPKCDNLTKYPDKKQIEDKLTQIREYLQITTSLMSSMKNTDEQLGDSTERNNLAQMINDLKDSETKLVNILTSIDESEADGNDNYGDVSLRNELEDKIITTNRELEILREQQMSLLNLQQKADQKLRDARQVQEKLLGQYGNDVNSTMHQRDKNLTTVQDFDHAINELEERTRRINSRGPQCNAQEKITSEMDSLQSQILLLHNVNDERNQLIQVLDNRDSELRAQHQELQSKLTELQTKKMQIDHLVTQLQTMDEAEEDDVGMQVRRIVTMKDQLAKLKDMLEVVKATENGVQNEDPEGSCDMCIKSENVDRPRSDNARYDKQVNKNTVGSFGGARPKSSSNANKVALQVELEAKKRELEEIMGKHKAGTSNLNHDVGTDSKSEFSCASNTFNESSGAAWVPLAAEHNRFDSSDSEDHDEYTNQAFPPPLLNYPPAKPEKTEYLHLQETDRLSSIPRTPERQSSSVATPRDRSNSKNQVQQQLELIKSVCDSMLEQPQTPNCQQLRNNLTRGSLYSEPRRFTSPMNALVESPWGQNDPAAYQGWLTANNLQTQTFMLNTLNQCCQMLWLQQREMMTLRQTVLQLQETFERENPSHLASPLQNPERRSNQKSAGNHVAAACSMPNLNQYNIPAVNLDPSFQNNMQSARLLDPCLNNNEHINNSVLHAVNANINGHLWNGQALNNQVAPGNRANNYWDNFRSYSRQNLLSTKSNEGLQNLSSLERSFAPLTISKSNSGQTSSQENTPIRRPQCVRNSEHRNNAVPPDVLNVNQNVNKIEIGANQRNVCYHPFAHNEISSSRSNISEEQIFKDCVSESSSRRNEWHEEQAEESHSKSKLFEELRENVYKEVISLISANETRPHFLIQLFRDLQMISSDPLRLKILQSIQAIITHSLISTGHPNPVQQTRDDNFSLQNTVWSKSQKNPSRPTGQMDENLEMQSVIKEIIPYLNDHEDDVMSTPFLTTLKKLLIESEAFQDTVRDAVFKKHFSNVLDEVLAQFTGKKLRDNKMHVIQTINDLLRGELSFIQLIQDTCPETCEGGELNVAVLNGHGDQNGDLAEADQGRVDEDDVEEEGAVGGFWDLALESPIANAEESDVPIEFQNSAESQTQMMKQGLDQVPTRLPIKSRSNTPSRAGSSRSDHPEPF